MRPDSFLRCFWLISCFYLLIIGPRCCADRVSLLHMCFESTALHTWMHGIVGCVLLFSLTLQILGCIVFNREGLCSVEWSSLVELVSFYTAPRAFRSPMPYLTAAAGDAAGDEEFADDSSNRLLHVVSDMGVSIHCKLSASNFVFSHTVVSSQQSATFYVQCTEITWRPWLYRIF